MPIPVTFTAKYLRPKLSGIDPPVVFVKVWAESAAYRKQAIANSKNLHFNGGKVFYIVVLMLLNKAF